jgi:hypothetical protein
MNKKILYIILAVFVVLVGFFILNKKSENLTTNTDVTSKVEDKVDNLNDVTILPFKSGVSGTVLLGPTCPGPTRSDSSDNACADRPYETSIQVMKAGDSKSLFASITTNKVGKFAIMLPPGDYTLQPTGGSVFPRCGVQNVTVSPNVILEVNLSCDSGIR